MEGIYIIFSKFSLKLFASFALRRSPRGPSLLTNNMYSNGTTERNTEAMNGKFKPSACDRRRMESRMVNHSEDYEDWGCHYKEYPIMDSSSDSSSVFSVSDAGSYSTDSTRESGAEDISGYIFGSSLHHLG